MEEKVKIADNCSAQLISFPRVIEEMKISGRFEVECRDKDGNLKWKDTIDNLVTTVGKNYALDGYLQTAVTIVGPYMGIIGAATTGPAAGDTMGSHGGWTEGGGANPPTYSGNRKTCVWAGASGGTKALSAALSFTFTGSGTAKGCFIVLNTGASATKDDTGGTLYSAGYFTGGDKAVVDTDVLNVSYTASLNA